MATMLRKQKEYEGNPVGLTRETAEAMAGELDRHLATFLIIYQQYHKHHWLVEGPQFHDLHLFLEKHYTEIHGDYDSLAERLTVMGFAPTCHPVNMAKIAYIEHEEEGVFRVRDMLRRDLEAEKAIAIHLRRSIKLALSHDDFATKNLLEGILFRVEDRAHHLEHFLGEDSLAVGLYAKEGDMMEDEATEKILSEPAE